MSCASVSINGSKLIPIQTVSINKNWIKTDDTTLIGSRYDITLEGTLVALKGSPRGTGTYGDPSWSGFNNMFWVGQGSYPPDETGGLGNQFQSLLGKTEALRGLLTQEGKLIEIQSSEGVAPIKGPFKLINLSFAPGNWIYTVPYTIQLEADYLLGAAIVGSGEDSFAQNLNSANENWSLEFNAPENAEQQHTWRVTHNVAAQGKRFYEIDGALRREAYLEAKEWVENRLGFDIAKISSSGTMNLVAEGYTAWNHVRLVNVDETAGSYNVTESWILATGGATEDFTVSSSSSATDPLYRVTVEGSILGLDLIDYATSGIFVTRSKYASASGYFNSIVNQLYQRAYGYANASGFARPLNPTPASTQVNRNPVLGTISYNYAFDTRRSLCLTGIGVLSEDITLTDNSPTDIFAVIPILGRAAGPVLQGLNTKTEARRGMAVQLTMLPATGCPVSANKVASLLRQSPYYDVDVLFDSMEQYLRASYPYVYISQDTDTWNPYAGTYSRNMEWVIGFCNATDF